MGYSVPMSRIPRPTSCLLSPGRGRWTVSRCNFIRVSASQTRNIAFMSTDSTMFGACKQNKQWWREIPKHAWMEDRPMVPGLYNCSQFRNTKIRSHFFHCIILAELSYFRQLRNVTVWQNLRLGIASRTYTRITCWFNCLFSFVYCFRHKNGYNYLRQWKQLKFLVSSDHSVN